MKISKRILVLTLVAFALPALAGGSGLAERVTAWQAAFDAGDTAALAAHYTEDGVRMPPNMAVVKGRAAIEQNISTTRSTGITRVVLAATHDETQGNLGWGAGTYELWNADGDKVDEGKWMNVSVKREGKWLIVRDIWNSNLPLPE